jgi:nifR3 family TIM-barrel protein
MKLTKGFWEDLEKPMMLLAPMEDVTDNAFREIIAKYGKPDAMYTEFTSADGVMSEGRENVIHRFEYNDTQRPIVAQIFSKNPKKMEETTRFCVKMGFDGVDINMGCPKDNICRQGSGCGMIRTPKVAQEVIRAAQKGAAGEIPITVKTRLGYYKKEEYKEWVKYLLDTEPVKLTMHGRTKKDMSNPPADWDYIAKVVELRDSLGSDAYIIGNGDVTSLEDANQKVEEFGVDGVMIARGIFGNPWLFNKNIKKEDLPLEEVLEVLLEHVELYDNYFKWRKNFHYLRKHFKSYISGYHNIKELRHNLLHSNNSEEVKDIIKTFLEENHG